MLLSTPDAKMEKTNKNTNFALSNHIQMFNKKTDRPILSNQKQNNAYLSPSNVREFIFAKFMIVFVLHDLIEN